MSGWQIRVRRMTQNDPGMKKLILECMHLSFRPICCTTGAYAVNARMRPSSVCVQRNIGNMCACRVAYWCRRGAGGGRCIEDEPNGDQDSAQR